MQSRSQPDGFGMGTFAEDGTPRVERGVTAAWQDKGFARGGARSARGRMSCTCATRRPARSRYATAIPSRDRRLFAHNGVVEDLPTLEGHLGDARARRHRLRERLRAPRRTMYPGARMQQARPSVVTMHGDVPVCPSVYRPVTRQAFHNRSRATPRPDTRPEEGRSVSLPVGLIAHGQLCAPARCVRGAAPPAALSDRRAAMNSGREGRRARGRDRRRRRRRRTRRDVGQSRARRGPTARRRTSRRDARRRYRAPTRADGLRRARRARRARRPARSNSAIRRSRPARSSRASNSPPVAAVSPSRCDSRASRWRSALPMAVTSRARSAACGSLTRPSSVRCGSGSASSRRAISVRWPAT